MQTKPYYVKDFVAFVADRPQLASMTGQPNREQLFLNYVDAVQTQLLEEKVKRESPDYKWLLKEYYEGILLFEIMEKEVWNKAMEDTLGQRNYFRAHATDYKAGERMVGKIYSSSSKVNLDQLKNLFQSKDTTFREFISKHRIRQDSGSFEKEDRAILSKINWSPGESLVENNGVNYLVLVEKILPPGPETFQEARASVISDYQTWLEKSWIRELKRKFGVKLEKKAKRKVFEQLTEK